MLQMRQTDFETAVERPRFKLHFYHPLKELIWSSPKKKVERLYENFILTKDFELKKEFDIPLYYFYKKF